MANIKKEIETLRAKIARLEQEQEKEEQRKKALDAVQAVIDKTLRENGISFEAYIRSNYTQIKRIVAKIEKRGGPSDTPPKRVIKKRAAGKRRKSRKVTVTIKIPAGKYGNLPAEPDTVFNVKEKGPRPKALKSYAEEIGLEAFLAQCRLDK
ncbi:MAG: hypothetical protein KZQ80_00390 [Candidatus Thiodiazotropha sp. (ex Monitilora ramsayi)]|nr:hypothetical protein [Candidatus Thiodiazotropha sp. (ex Monitilora ramsayi)]